MAIVARDNQLQLGHGVAAVETYPSGGVPLPAFELQLGHGVAAVETCRA